MFVNNAPKGPELESPGHRPGDGDAAPHDVRPIGP